MLRGLYTSASGMLVESLKTDVVANNLANVQTHGFKRQSSSVRAFPELLIHRINDAQQGRSFAAFVGNLGTGAAIDELALNMTPGPIKYTGRSLDLALDGPGFFVVERPEGQLAYTRDGAARVDSQGFLALASGDLLLGTDGPIHVGNRQPWVDDEGRVWVDDQLVGQLWVVEFAEPRALERLGENMLLPTEGSGEPAPAVNTVVRGEHLEAANVNVVREMVDLIAIQRAYEANQRMIQVQDETLGRLINDAASLA